MHAYYHGVESKTRAGHRWYEGGLRPSGSAWRDTLKAPDPARPGRDRHLSQPPGWPWKRHADGNFYSGRVEGRAELHHRAGWTVLAFEDRSGDSRPASNSVFAFDAELTFDEALSAARLYFPTVWERIDFEVVQRV